MGLLHGSGSEGALEVVHREAETAVAVRGAVPHQEQHLIVFVLTVRGPSLRGPSPSLGASAEDDADIQTEGLDCILDVCKHEPDLHRRWSAVHIDVAQPG